MWSRRCRTLHTVLTDNGIQFVNRSSDRYAFRHIFGRVCEEHGIEHRLTKVKHPWTNGQVERMNRTIKGLTPYEFICQQWTEWFRIDPFHHLAWGASSG